MLKFVSTMKRKTNYSPYQMDLFGYQEKDSDKLHRLKIRQEKNLKSFMVRYNLVLEEHARIDAEIDELNLKLGEKNDTLNNIEPIGNFTHFAKS